MYRNALIPIDGSEYPGLAINQLPHLLTGPDRRVVIVEVIDTAERILAQTTPAGFAFDGGSGALLLDQVLQEQQLAADRHLTDAEEHLRRLGFTSVERRVVAGIPGPEIVALARDEHSDIVVIATHGRTGVNRTIFGSVAEHVVRHLQGVPVVLIQPAPAPEAAAASPARRETDCDDLRAALAAAKARLRMSPLKAGMENDAGLSIAVDLGIHERGLLSAEVAQIEEALRANGCMD